MMKLDAKTMSRLGAELFALRAADEKKRTKTGKSLTFKEETAVKNAVAKKGAK